MTEIEISALTQGQDRTKRSLDVGLGAVLLVVVGWLIPVLAVLARWDTGGSGIYRQARVGRDGVPFEVCKLRTMRVGADLRGSTTAAGDIRVTPLGNRLRRYKLDELPQLINVLKGEMSLVGPRPTVQSDYDRMTPHQRQRVLVRPGITGAAQLAGNTQLSWPARTEFDLDYISTWTLWADLKIIAQTLSGFAAGALHTDPDGDDEWA